MIATLNMLCDVICVTLSVMQPTLRRRTAACCVALPAAIHLLLLNDTTGLTYYLSAAAMCFVTILLLSKVGGCNMIDGLENLTILMIIMSLVGYVMWYSYFNYDMYNFGILTLNLGMIFVLVTGDVNGRITGRVTVCGRRCMLHFNDSRGGKSTT